MIKTCHFDTETLGIYGPAAILQCQFNYATEQHAADEAFIYDLWHNSVSQTVYLIEEIVECRVVAHNIVFDWEKISQYYCAIMELQALFGPNARPIDYIDTMAELLYSERSAYCLKPKHAVCTLLLCQKTLGGTSLAAKEIRVRKLPNDIAEVVANILNKNTDLPQILFARRNTDVRWAACACDEGDAWSDVALKFGPSNSLKDVAKFVLGIDNTIKIGAEVQPPPYPKEYGYAPYAKLVRSPRSGWFDTDGDPLWPELLTAHLNFWTLDETARTYALMDIDLLVKLDNHLGRLVSDFDSELACQVASVRVAGLVIDQEQLEVQTVKSEEIAAQAKINVDSHVQVREYIESALDPMEALVCAETVNKATLKKMRGAFVLTEREECCKDGCGRCNGTGFVGPGPMPVVDRCNHILDTRKHRKRLQLFDKLRVAKSAFPAFRVIGTKSGRMSGTAGLNYHGIDGSKDIREIFTLADPGWVVSGGDMNSQELAIAAAVMNDENLADDIGKGRSLHGVFAAAASGIPYDKIMANKDDKDNIEAVWYGKAKVCVYAILYGAASYNIAQTLGITPEEAEKVIQDFFEKYPYMAQTRKMVKASLEALKSDSDSRLKQVDPQQNYIDSCFGFRRSFETEFQVMQTMLDSMAECKKVLDNYPGKVLRKEAKGPQTHSGAVASALYGATFSLQGKILRAALNHLIQSAGRTVTLRVQKRAWDAVQPVGIHPFRIKILSVHDEIITTSPPEYAPVIEAAVVNEMSELCKTVPLLSLDWATDVGSWYGVKAAETGLVRAGWAG